MRGRLFIAGVSSGVGKTTITMGLIAALRQRGWRVQPFKAGPDYIDPTYHTLAAGQPCRNIDTWMVPPERALALFEGAVKDSDLAVIEGVMGLFDGFSYSDEEGSSAQIAKLVGAALLLVLDVGKMARSAGALALGYAQFDPALPIAGFILNRCGSSNHYEGVKRAVEEASQRPVVGWLPKEANLHIPERHLGLVPTNERGALSDFIAYTASLIETHFEMDRIIEMARQTDTETKQTDRTTIQVQDYADSQSTVRIAVARDAAFSFYYEDNLDLLRHQGAEICFFSPLTDSGLPADISGLYLGGGFPEMHAAQLTANRSLLQAIRQAHNSGLPIYAECGGFMYLTEAIIDLAGVSHPMVGIVPGQSQMQQRRASLGYRLVESPAGNFLLPPGMTTRGHEFHWSAWLTEEGHQTSPAWHIRPRQAEQVSRPDGYTQGNLIASYVHLHFAHTACLAENFVQTCKRWGEGVRRP